MAAYFSNLFDLNKILDFYFVFPKMGEAVLICKFILLIFGNTRGFSS